MSHATKPLRRVELSLWILGVLLLGIALTSTLTRWRYQNEQERALFQGGSALSIPAEPRQLPVLAKEIVNPRPAPAKPAPVPATARVEAKSAASRPAPSGFGRIEIPRLGVKAIVKEGGDEKTLARAVGLIPGSAKPGERGNTVLAGHRDTFFSPLRDIKVNDTIRLAVPGRTYEYRVQWISIVSPDDTGLLQSKGNEELTLVTCYPFSMVGPAPDRFIVSATRVN